MNIQNKRKADKIARPKGKTNPPNICIISFPQPSAIVVNAFLYNLIEILNPICNKIYVITSNFNFDNKFNEKIKIKNVKISLHQKGTIYPIWLSNIFQFFKIIIIQLKMCLILFKVSKKTDLVFFYIGGTNICIPLFFAKILRKKVIISALGLGSLSHSDFANKNFININKIFVKIIHALEQFNFYFSDKILVESSNVMDFLNLGNNKKKIITTGARYIDTDFLKIDKKFLDRENFIGYIGRLDKGKGIMNFVESIPSILKLHNDAKFLIVGNGPLYMKIKEELTENGTYHKVELTNWIPHYKISDYLNNLKILILPSYSEGLPTIILEAMACGTPVLASPVGGIPDIIRDNETGFILEENSPRCILDNVSRILNHSDMERIIQKARKLIEMEFNYEAAVERYNKIIMEMFR